METTIDIEEIRFQFLYLAKFHEHFGDFYDIITKYIDKSKIKFEDMKLRSEKLQKLYNYPVEED